MFSKVALFATAFLAAFAVANPVLGRGEPAPGNSCSNGSVMCCDSVQDATSSAALDAAAACGADLKSTTGQVGLGCSAPSLIGLGGPICSSQTAYCSGNNFNGLLVVGCSPIAINVL